MSSAAVPTPAELSAPDINHLTFVGSTTTGRSILQATATNIVPTKIELGGKSAALVFDDADVGAAAYALSRSIVVNAGQKCNALSRVIVDRRVVDAFVEAAREAMDAVRIGAWDIDVDMRPVVNATQRDRVLGFIERAKSEGASTVTGGCRADDHDRGYCVAPSLFDRAENSMEVPERRSSARFLRSSLPTVTRI